MRYEAMGGWLIAASLVGCGDVNQDLREEVGRLRVELDALNATIRGPGESPDNTIPNSNLYAAQSAEIRRLIGKMSDGDARAFDILLRKIKPNEWVLTDEELRDLHSLSDGLMPASCTAADIEYARKRYNHAAEWLQKNGGVLAVLRLNEAYSADRIDQPFVAAIKAARAGEVTREQANDIEDAVGRVDSFDALFERSAMPRQNTIDLLLWLESESGKRLKSMGNQAK